MTIQTGIDGYRILAERSGKYAGQIGPEWCDESGEWKDYWISNKPPVAARVGVLRRDFDKPIWGMARYASYEQPSSPIWRKMPEVMLAKCFSEDTEVLTDQGFQKFSEATGRILQVTDNGLEPTDSVPFVQDYNGVMVTLNSDDVNFSVTPNHDMLTTEGKIEAMQMYDQSRARPKFWIPRLVKTKKSGLPVSNEQIRIAAAFLADGSKVSNTSFKIEVSRERKVEVLRTTGLYRYEGTRNTAGQVAHTAVRDIVTGQNKARFVYDFSLISWLCSPDKSINMESILQMSQEQAQCLATSLVDFDGHIQKDTGAIRFYTSRKDHLEAFGLACCVAGFSINKAVERISDISTKINYCATVSTRDNIPVSRWGRFYKYEKPHTSEREQTGLKLTRNVSGKVWCVTVPSGVIVVRRNGFSMLCGNCAEALALRRAFPAELSGLYTKEEMDQADMPLPTPAPERAPSHVRIVSEQPEPAQTEEQAKPVEGEVVQETSQEAPTVSVLRARVAEIRVSSNGSILTFEQFYQGVTKQEYVSDDAISPEACQKINRQLDVIVKARENRQQAS